MRGGVQKLLGGAERSRDLPGLQRSGGHAQGQGNSTCRGPEAGRRRCGQGPRAVPAKPARLAWMQAGQQEAGSASEAGPDTQLGGAQTPQVLGL